MNLATVDSTQRSTAIVALTTLAARYAAGDDTVLDEISPDVYRELKAVARNHLRAERSDHTLQATAVVNEAFVRLGGTTDLVAQDRAHFFRLASRVMRHVLVDHARMRRSEKRGGDRPMQSFDDTVAAYQERVSVDVFAADASVETQLEQEHEFLRLDEAITALRDLSARQAEVVDLRFFGGLSVEDTATTLGISVATVKRDWTVARAFMQQHIEQRRAGG